MRTQIQVLRDNIQSSIKTLHNLSGYSHTSEDISVHIKTAGASIERFLKESVYNTPRSGVNFYNLINGLMTYGISQLARDKFHDLRVFYNDVKHDASFHIELDDAL